MELRNSLYNRGEWIEENGTWRVNITLHSSHIIFQSHFHCFHIDPNEIRPELLGKHIIFLYFTLSFHLNIFNSLMPGK